MTNSIWVVYTNQKLVKANFKENEMIKKRLIQLSEDSMKHIKRNVFYQWLALCANIILVLSVSNFIEQLYQVAGATASPSYNKVCYFLKKIAVFKYMLYC